MKNTDVLNNLDNLSIRMEGLASMVAAVDDAITYGPAESDAYKPALHLLTDLMAESSESLNKNVRALRDEKRPAHAESKEDITK